MGTRSTVKFKATNGDVIASYYQQYDGYVEGVGAQIAKTLKRWVVEGVTTTRYNDFLKQEMTDTNKANGVFDLALLYVVDNKDGAMNMYATNPDDTQEFDYVVEDTGKEYVVSVYEEFYVNDEVGYKGKLKFKGNTSEFIEFVERKLGEPV